MLARCSRRASAAMVLPTFDITRALVDPNAHHQAAGLSYILQRLRLHLIPLTAHDVYQLCTTAYHTNTLGLMEDAEVMRALADAFQRADQRVLTPFQVSLITDTLRKAGIVATPTEVLVPTEEEVSPESVLHLLRSMRVNKMRDERKTDAALNLLIPFLDEMNPTTLSAIIIELALLRSSKADMMNRLGKRVLHVSDELTTLDLSMTTKCLALTRGVPTNLLRRLYDAVSARMEELQPEDFVHAMEGLCQLGPQFANTFAVFVEAGLEQVETFDALTLTHFLVGFTTMKYAQRDHVEIYADALIDVAQDLGEHDLVQATMALESLHLLSEDLFSSLSTCLLRFTPRMAPRYIAPVMDVCSVVPHDSSMLMQSLLDRALEATRVLSPNELANILEIASMYPPTKTHAVVVAFAKQAKMRMEIMAPESISTIVRGLANLGHDDAEVYVMATSAMMRFGFKNWSTLEPILMGLSLSGECSIATAKVMAGHLAPMARTMTVAEVQRANRYLMEIKCEEDFVYRALAARVLYFVKELTPDTPEDVQVLLQRGAVRRDDR